MKILITGADGFAAARIIAAWKDRHEITGTGRAPVSYTHLPDGKGFPTITYSTNDAGYHKAVAEYLQSAYCLLYTSKP